MVGVLLNGGCPATDHSADIFGRIAGRGSIFDDSASARYASLHAVEQFGNLATERGATKLFCAVVKVRSFLITRRRLPPFSFS
jgi:hypothetical protein